MFCVRLEQFSVWYAKKRQQETETEAGVETYLTIEELAQYLKVAEQTIRRWVLNREVPYCKIKKVIRFRLSEIEQWVDKGGVLSVTETTPEGTSGLFDETDRNEVAV
jgi:excisionase family DNA binding protein